MISIHPPHAGRDRTDELDLASMGISIHPPHAGRDLPETDEQQQAYISIHPPRAGRDLSASDSSKATGEFQSTRPVRGGTLPGLPASLHTPFQSTRPVRGGTINNTPGLYIIRFQSTRPVRGGTIPAIKAKVNDAISIHPPRAGRDIAVQSLQEVE